MTWQKLQKVREQIDQIVRESKEYMVKSREINPEFWQKPLVGVLEESLEGLSDTETTHACNLVDNANEELLKKYEVAKDMEFVVSEDDYTVLEAHDVQTVPPLTVKEEKKENTSQGEIKSLIPNQLVQPRPGDVDLTKGVAQTKPNYDIDIVQRALLKQKGKLSK